MSQIVIAALYQFLAVDNPAALQDALRGFCRDQGILGTLIVAGEGIKAPCPAVVKASPVCMSGCWPKASRAWNTRSPLRRRIPSAS